MSTPSATAPAGQVHTATRLQRYWMTWNSTKRKIDYIKDNDGGWYHFEEVEPLMKAHDELRRINASLLLEVEEWKRHLRNVLACGDGDPRFEACYSVKDALAALSPASGGV